MFLFLKASLEHEEGKILRIQLELNQVKSEIDSENCWKRWRNWSAKEEPSQSCGVHAEHPRCWDQEQEWCPEDQEEDGGDLNEMEIQLNHANAKLLRQQRILETHKEYWRYIGIKQTWCYTVWEYCVSQILIFQEDYMP